MRAVEQLFNGSSKRRAAEIEVVEKRKNKGTSPIFDNSPIAP
jgi:hypothetical protein